MKRNILKPTNENLIEMLEKDVVRRNKYIKDFILFLDSIDGGISISINGDWGTGKTFFVKQLKIILESLNNYINTEDSIKNIMDIEVLKEIKIKSNFVPIYYNAWNNDSHNDPIISILFNIIKETNVENSLEKNKENVIGKVAAIVDVVNIFTSGSATNLINSFKKENIANEIQTMEDINIMLDDIFNEILVENGEKIVFIVDELDRCNPIYAIKVLERIKHFFDNDKIIFIFSTNIIQLINTIHKYYGDDFDASKYLNKFFDISLELPDVDSESYMKFLGLEKNSYYFNIVSFDMAKYYNFSMRDCARFFQSLNIVKDYILKFKGGFSEQNGYLMTLIFILPFLFAVKIVDREKYNKILLGNGKREFSDLVNNIESLKNGLYSYINKEQKDNQTIGLEKEIEKIYETIFDNKNNLIYSGNNMKLDKESRKYLLDIVNLVNENLKYYEEK